MARYQVAFDASAMDVIVQTYGAATVAGYDNIGNFYHDGPSGVDVLGDESERDPDTSHVIYHHIRDLLYAEGVQDMARVTINVIRPTAIDATATDVDLSLASDTSEQIAVAFTPADTSNKDVTYESSDPDVLTVSASGLVTAVAAGNASVTVRSVARREADGSQCQDVLAFTVAA